MLWLNRFLTLIGILVVATMGWLYGKTGDIIALGVGIFGIIVITASVCLMAETRYNEGYVAGMEWFKNLWGIGESK